MPHDQRSWGECIVGLVWLAGAGPAWCSWPGGAERGARLGRHTSSGPSADGRVCHGLRAQPSSHRGGCAPANAARTEVQNQLKEVRTTRARCAQAKSMSPLTASRARVRKPRARPSPSWCTSTPRTLTLARRRPSPCVTSTSSPPLTRWAGGVLAWLKQAPPHLSSLASERGPACHQELQLRGKHAGPAAWSPCCVVTMLLHLCFRASAHLPHPHPCCMLPAFILTAW